MKGRVFRSVLVALPVSALLASPSACSSESRPCEDTFTCGRSAAGEGGAGAGGESGREGNAGLPSGGAGRGGETMTDAGAAGDGGEGGSSPTPDCGPEPCVADHATAACEGVCVIETCHESFFDCNGEYQDGCEVADVPRPEVPRLLRPFRGAYSGSLHASASAGVFRPRFDWSDVPTSCGTLRYELALDDSCSPGSLESCPFDSPELEVAVADSDFVPSADLPVARTAPVGALYAWRVRACDGSERCSTWSDVGYVHVGRTSQDVNGDGFADIVLRNRGAAGEWLDVLYGSAQMNTAHDARIPEELIDPRYAGDLDSDGFGDLTGTATSAEPCGPSLSGYHVRVILGGVEPASFVVKDLCRTAGTSSVVLRPAGAGDLDGDGFADLGVGRGFGSENNFQIYAGGPELSTTPIADVLGGSGSYAFTQTSPAFAAFEDLDADSYVDVVVAERQNGPPLLLHRLRGGPTLDDAFHESIEHPACVSLGGVVPAGDANGDGYGDFGVVCSGSEYHFDLLPGGGALVVVDGLQTSAPISSASRALDFDDDGALEWILGFPASSAEAPMIWSTRDPENDSNRWRFVSSAQIQSADHGGNGRLDLTLSDGSASTAWLGSSTSFNVSPLAIGSPDDVADQLGIAY
jgi:hypothetical protein